MLEALRRRAAVASCILSLAAALSCGGGGGDSIPAGTCRRAAIPTSGPGDTLNYFPAELGRSWTYRDPTSGTMGTTTVSGTQVVGAETAFVFTTTTTSDPSPQAEVVVKRPAGAYVLSDPSVEPPFDQLYPSMILPFPVAVMAPTEQATCRALDLGDLDGDGKPDHADLVVTLRVFSIAETAGVPAGQFSDVAHTQLVGRVTATATTGGTVVVDATQDDWYARDVGRVLSLLALTAPGMSESSTAALESWTLPGSGQARAPVAPGPSGAPRLEEAALRLARQAVGAAR